MKIKVTLASLTPEEEEVVARFSIPFEFKRGTKSDDHGLLYIKHVWQKANGEIFSGRLKPPVFKFLKDQSGFRFRKRGHWDAGKRVLAASRRIFQAQEAHALTLILHEMCHQAVTEIDRTIDPNQGHGPHWEAWMRKCGLTPSRYDKQDNTEYMSDEEKAPVIRHREAVKEVAPKLEKWDGVYRNGGVPVTYHNLKTDRWEKGLLVAPSDPGRSAIVLEDTLFNGTYMRVPDNLLFLLPQSDPFYEVMQHPAWKKAEMKVRQAADDRKQARKRTLK